MLQSINLVIYAYTYMCRNVKILMKISYFYTYVVWFYVVGDSKQSRNQEEVWEIDLPETWQYGSNVKHWYALAIILR